jgi:hypothetical protein
VIFTLGLIFCAIVPLIAIFELMFFFIKYFIDKYNLSFVYNKEFEGGGAIKDVVLPFIIFSVILFQVMNVGFFALTFSTGYLIGGAVLILVEIIGICYIKAAIEKKKGNKK